jgi:hypothetical protein
MVTAAAYHQGPGGVRVLNHGQAAGTASRPRPAVRLASPPTSMTMRLRTSATPSSPGQASATLDSVRIEIPAGSADQELPSWPLGLNRVDRHNTPCRICVTGRSRSPRPGSKKPRIRRLREHVIARFSGKAVAAGDSCAIRAVRAGGCGSGGGPQGLDEAAGPGSAGEPFIPGQQCCLYHLGQCHVGRVIHGERGSTGALPARLGPGRPGRIPSPAPPAAPAIRRHPHSLALSRQHRAASGPAPVLTGSVSWQAVGSGDIKAAPDMIAGYIGSRE